MASTLLQLRTSFLQPPNSNKLDSAQLGHFNPVPTRRSRRYLSVNCKVKPPVNASPPPAGAPASLMREPHKYFDQAVITVRAGYGGRGALLSVPGGGKADDKEKEKEKEKAGKDWKRGSYKRDFDGSVILPLGGKGGDVILYADEGRDTLLEFHGRSGRYCAKRGGNVDAVRVLNPQLRDGVDGGDLRIGVPLGTVVKRNNGKLLADLANLGDEVLVARGGHGGISLLKVPPYRRKKSMTLTTNMMRDESDKALVLGQPGEEVSLELILRVVADVGLVGLPNAGKSTLLAAITRAKPDIADYPFTTLMPNLGRLDGDPTLGAGRYSSEATLADLPGLIEGAHLGKGLGRNFLRHLRRTRLLVHVVDAAAEDPVNDYRTVKEELRMYNPDYLDRPYIVVLNKIDLPKAIERITYLTEKIQQIGKERGSLELEKTSNGVAELDNTDVDVPSAKASDIRREKEIEDYPGPLAVVAVSVLNGIQVGEMLQAIRAALRTYPEFTVT